MSGDQISLVKNVGTDQVAIQTSENSLMVLQAGQQGPPGPVNAISGTGIVVQTALNTFVTRSVVAGSTGITVTNGDGVAGNVSLALAAVLVSIVAGTMNGVVIGNTTPAAGTFTTLSATGAATFADGSAANPSITFTSDPDTGMYRYGVNSLAFATTGVLRLGLDANGLYNYTNQFTFGASADVSLNREAANTLAQRNSTNAQIFRLYNTYTDGSNYERVELRFNAGDFELANAVLGTGSTARALKFFGGSSAGSPIQFGTGSTVRWRIDSGSNVPFLPAVDNSYDIGTTSLRPRDLYIGRQVGVGVTTQAGHTAFFRNNGLTDVDLYAVTASPAGPSTNTGRLWSFRSDIATTNAVYTTTSAQHFVALTTTKGASNTLSLVVGFNAVGGAQVTGVLSRAFVGSFASDSANAFNLYMDGTAPNVLVGLVSLGSTNAPAASLDFNGNVSASSWTTNGIGLRIRGNTYTDTSTGVSGTAATNHIHAIAAPTLAATNATVTTTNAATLYIAGAPTAGTNMTITNGYALFVNNGDVNFGTGSGNVYRNRGGTYGQALLNGEIQNIVPSGISCSIRLIQTGIVDGRISNEATTGNLTFTAFAATEIKNATTAQIFRVYNTFTDSSNYERGYVRWNSNFLEFGGEAAGTGTDRNVRIRVSGAAGGILFYTNGNDRWLFTNAGHFSAGTDNAYDIGTTSLRPRDVYVAGTLYVGATAAYLGSKANIQQTSTTTASGTETLVYVGRIDAPASNSSNTGTAFFVESTFNAGTTVTGATQHGVYSRVAASNSGTGALSVARSYVSEYVQSNGARTTGTVTGYYAAVTTVSAGSVTNYHGFDCLDQNSANIGTAIAYRGRMASGTNRWNLYMDGTAPSYFAGNIYAGTLTQIASERFALQASDASTSGSPRMIFARYTLNPGSASTMDAILAQFRTSVTTNNGANTRIIRADLETGASVTVPQFVGFEASTSLSVTAGVLTTGYGFYSSPGTNGTIGMWHGFTAANDGGNVTVHYGFRGLVAAGTTQWNLFMDGTANNAIVGLTSFGSTTTPAASIDMNGNVSAASWTTNGIGLRLRGNTYTDSSTAISGTAVTNHIHAIAIPTLAATNATVTTTTAATLYIAGAPTAGSNMTITNARALLVNAGTSEFGGQVLSAAGTSANPSFGFSTAANTGMYLSGGNTIVLSQGSNNVVGFQNSASVGVTIASTLPLAWNLAGQDLFLFRDAANSLGQRNGTNAQVFRVYNTYTDASNFERGAFSWSSNVLRIGTQVLGTGVSRPLTVTIGNTDVWTFNTTGHLSTATDNNYDLGTSSLRPRTAYIGTSLVVQGPTGFVNGVTITAVATTVSPTIVAAGSDTNITLTISSKGTGDLKLDPASGDIQITKALVALGGGAAPTFGTIGGSGPATAAQNTWLRLKDSGGNAFWVPVWK